MKFPRPQLHLSTCIVLMFVAGGLMGMNFAIVPWVPYVDGDPANGTSSSGNFRAEIEAASRYGWPITFYKRSLIKFYNSSGQVVVEAARNYYSRWRLAADIGLGPAILAAVAFVCERVIRRQKPAVKNLES